jgi:hypothetical protein
MFLFILCCSVRISFVLVLFLYVFLYVLLCICMPFFMSSYLCFFIYVFLCFCCLCFLSSVVMYLGVIVELFWYFALSFLFSLFVYCCFLYFVFVSERKFCSRLKCDGNKNAVATDSRSTTRKNKGARSF